ncbi:MAG: hypothetical protein VX378_06080 [Pseudomonadota bacterium]|nr:hypothetical protein [Pseudomonadota bacterium]
MSQNLNAVINRRKTKIQTARNFVLTSGYSYCEKRFFQNECNRPLKSDIERSGLRPAILDQVKIIGYGRNLNKPELGDDGRKIEFFEVTFDEELITEQKFLKSLTSNEKQKISDIKNTEGFQKFDYDAISRINEIIQRGDSYKFDTNSAKSISDRTFSTLGPVSLCFEVSSEDSLSELGSFLNESSIGLAVSGDGWCKKVSEDEWIGFSRDCVIIVRRKSKSSSGNVPLDYLDRVRTVPYFFLYARYQKSLLNFFADTLIYLPRQGHKLYSPETFSVSKDVFRFLTEFRTEFAILSSTCISNNPLAKRGTNAFVWDHLYEFFEISEAYEEVRRQVSDVDTVIKMKEVESEKEEARQQSLQAEKSAQQAEVLNQKIGKWGLIIAIIPIVIEIFKFMLES